MSKRKLEYYTTRTVINIRMLYLNANEEILFLTVFVCHMVHGHEKYLVYRVILNCPYIFLSCIFCYHYSKFNQRLTRNELYLFIIYFYISNVKRSFS